MAQYNNDRSADPAQSLRLSELIYNSEVKIMCDEREKIRCLQCELVQWRDRASCRRCGTALPEPIVKIVERVVEKVVIRQDPQCLRKLEQAHSLISAATERLQQPGAEKREFLSSSARFQRQEPFRRWLRWSGRSSWRLTRGRIGSHWKPRDCWESARPLCTASSERWAKRQHDGARESVTER